MSKHRQEKAKREQERVTENLNTANNLALTLYDIYTRDALENYLGFWRPPESQDDWESDEEEEEGSDSASSSSNSAGMNKNSAKPHKAVKKQKKGKKKGGSESDDWDDNSSSSSGEDTADPVKAKKLLMEKLEKHKEELVT